MVVSADLLDIALKKLNLVCLYRINLKVSSSVISGQDDRFYNSSLLYSSYLGNTEFTILGTKLL